MGGKEEWVRGLLSLSFWREHCGAAKGINKGDVVLYPKRTKYSKYRSKSYKSLVGIGKRVAV